jgi:Flp pilus assembly protein TadG
MGMRFERKISPGGGVKGVVRRFGRREDGSAIVFTLFMISVLLLVTGYAIDAARFESNRIRLQGTLDRAVLAAASLTQSESCEDVIDDYFAKAGLDSTLDEVDCNDISDNGRSVSASASIEMDTMFMKGVDNLVAPASGAASESIMDIEIVLALDVTGSMDGSRIENLRDAANAFTDKVLGADEDDRVSIAVVPYNAQVHLDPWLLNALPGVFGKSGYDANACIDLPASVWSTPGIDPATPMPQQPFVTVIDSEDYGTTSYTAPAILPELKDRVNELDNSCVMNGREDLRVKLPSQDVTGIKAGIDSLLPKGATSIFLGMKWGVTMIDPLMRPIYTEAIQDGLMPETLAGRPYDYDRENTMKVIVLMTDGGHFWSPYVSPGYHSGPSGIYRGDDGNYAIHHPTWPGPNKYFVPHLATGSNPGDTEKGWMPTPAWSSSVVVTQLDWVDVWKQLTWAWVLNQLYARPLSNNTDPMRYNHFWSQHKAMFPVTVRETMDSQLLATCTQAKEMGVEVFTVAFEAPARAQTLLQGCASSIDKYYAPVGAEIGDAFDSIANTINVLKLTQ